MRVRYLLETDGAGCSRDPRQTPEALTIQRRREQRAAAEILAIRHGAVRWYALHVRQGYYGRAAYCVMVRDQQAEESW